MMQTKRYVLIVTTGDYYRTWRAVQMLYICSLTITRLKRLAFNKPRKKPVLGLFHCFSINA